LRKYWITAVLVIGIFTIGIMSYNFVINHHQAATKEAHGVNVGNAISEFTLTGLDGKKVTVGKDKRITVINFWATWCPPCRAEFPELVSFSQKNRDAVQFYSVDLQEDESKISAFFKTGGYSLPVLLDADGQIAKMFRVTAIPTTIVVDADGIIRYRKSGAVTANELETIIKKL
jgi:thiol-disulfide isomerase/thioredoxin